MHGDHRKESTERRARNWSILPSSESGRGWLLQESIGQNVLRMYLPDLTPPGIELSLMVDVLFDMAMMSSALRFERCSEWHCHVRCPTLRELFSDELSPCFPQTGGAMLCLPFATCLLALWSTRVTTRLDPSPQPS